jgi:hypothetical protein
LNNKTKINPLLIEIIFFSAASLNLQNPCKPPLANFFQRGSQGWVGLIHHIHAAVAANGSTMATWFVGWSMRQLTIKIYYSYVDKAMVA